MAVQFAQPYRFSEQQLARMAEAGLVPEHGTVLIDGVPYWAGIPFRFSSEDYFKLGRGDQGLASAVRENGSARRLAAIAPPGLPPWRGG